MLMKYITTKYKLLINRNVRRDIKERNADVFILKKDFDNELFNNY